MPEIGIARSIASEKIISKISEGRTNKKSASKMPVGMFDSGVGGLSVLKEIMRQMPGEDVIYFGDTARVPYGGRPPQEIIKINYEVIDFLNSFNVKMVIMACGTSSAIAYPVVKDHYSIPLISLIEPACEIAAILTKNKKIGIIATQATIDSLAYESALKRINRDLEIFNVVCPLFVPLVESGFIESQETKWVAVNYLKPLIKAEIDTLIFGCTHYPFLVKVISEIMGENVTLVNPAEKAVEHAKNILKERGLASPKDISVSKPKYQFYVSGQTNTFSEVGFRLLEYPITNVKQAILPKTRKRV